MLVSEYDFAREGWERAGEADRWEVSIGPLWERSGDVARLFAIAAEPRHCRRNGDVAPGVIQTFFDAGLGAAAWDLMDRAPCVTMRMEVSLVRPAKAGSILVCRTTYAEFEGAFVYVSGRIEDALTGTIYATSNSVWKKLRA